MTALAFILQVIFGAHARDRRSATTYHVHTVNPDGTTRERTIR